MSTIDAMPDLNDLAITLAAADLGGFGAAARARHVSQSTVSRAVRRVEDALGRDLFSRVGRDAEPTESGLTAIAGLRQLLIDWQLLCNSAAARTTHLEVFCTLTASQTIVPELLADYRVEHPEVKLVLRTGPASAALDALVERRVDAAIAPLPRTLPRDVASVPVTVTDLVAIAAPDRSTWEDSALVLPESGLTRDLVDTWRRTALPRNIEIHGTANHEEVVALAALGSGIGIVPRLVVETSVLAQRLVLVEPPKPLPSMMIGLCVLRSTLTTEPVAGLWATIANASARTPQQNRLGTRPEVGAGHRSP